MRVLTIVIDRVSDSLLIYTFYMYRLFMNRVTYIRHL